MKTVLFTLVIILIAATIFSILVFQGTKPFAFNPDATTEDLINNPAYTPITLQYFIDTFVANFTFEFDLTTITLEQTKATLERVRDKWMAMVDLSEFEELWEEESKDGFDAIDAIKAIFLYIVHLVEAVIHLISIVGEVIYLVGQLLTIALTVLVDIIDMLIKAFTLVFRILSVSPA